MFPLNAVVAIAAAPQVSFPQSAAVTEQIALRWLHIVAGITWIGTLYFNNLAATPALKILDPPVRAKIFPELMSRAMWWFRWSALSMSRRPDLSESRRHWQQQQRGSTTIPKRCRLVRCP